MSDRTRNGPPRARRGGKAGKPLDANSLRDLALAYMARYATSTAKLERYLKRKIRERGWEDGENALPDLAGLIERYAGLGYVDDENYARARSGSLLRRGYGARRIGETLARDGIGQQMREEMVPGERAARAAALLLAQKRRFGPFAADRPTLERREKQIAALLRAGHSFDHARAVLDARDSDAAQQWVEEAGEDDDDALG